MSATITNDAFLVKGLNLSPDTIKNPLTYDGEKWYGEKMILLPSLMDGSLSRTAIIDSFAPAGSKRRFGIVALVPGARQAQDWQSKGSTIVDKNSIIQGVKRLREKHFAETLVIANYYDGIDLPDDTCRILILDSKPFADGLIDTYADSCRASSEVTSLKLARTIEQGLGRAVRGQKDYCVVAIETAFHRSGNRLAQRADLSCDRGFSKCARFLKAGKQLLFEELIQHDGVVAQSADRMNSNIESEVALYMLLNVGNHARQISVVKQSPLC
jgi:hypothetical protein